MKTYGKTIIFNFYKLTLFNALALTAFANCSHQKKFELIYYSGVIYDSTGQNTLKDCEVILGASYPYPNLFGKGYFEIARSYSDANGRFLFSDYAAARSDKYDVYVRRYSTNKYIHIKDVSSKDLQLDFCRILWLK